MSLKNTFKKTTLYKTVKLILKNKSQAYYILFLDIFFAITIIGFSFVTREILPSDPSVYISFLGNFRLALIVAIAIAIIYPLLLLIIYSFFKYGVIDIINTFHNRTNFTVNKLWKFYKLNVVVFGLPFLAFATYYIIASLAFRPGFANIIGLIVLPILLFLAYPFYNIAHALFSYHTSIKQIVRKSIQLLKKPTSYSPYLFALVGIGAYLLIFYAIGLTLGLTAFKDPLVFQQYYRTYANVFAVLLGLVLYKVIFINRIYFSLIVENAYKK